MRVHIVGICGTGMASLAGLLRDLGHTVSGSDLRFDPPMGPQLERMGVVCMTGWDPAHLGADLDAVVIGNVARSDNPEAVAALARGLRVLSLPDALLALVLHDRMPLVVAGTHGKTTTTTLLHHVLREVGIDAGAFIGGIAEHLGQSYTLGSTSLQRPGDLVGAPFVLEGDEYDSAYFQKEPKFWRYNAHAAILTSIEHDHVDVYPDEASYIATFVRFVRDLPSDGVLIAWAGSKLVREVASGASCKVAYYALDGDDTGDVAPVWFGAPAPDGAFDLFIGGSSAGRWNCGLIGHHNMRNAIAAIALCAELQLAPIRGVLTALSSARGAKRRQELVGEARGIAVYDDFAHHPTAVDATLQAFRQTFPSRRVIAAFEPRSATASRATHQAAYAHAFRSADYVVLAPVGRPEIAASEKLDVERVIVDIRANGQRGVACAHLDEVVAAIVTEAREGDIVVCMSNGRFGDVPDRALAELGRTRRAMP